jgi:tetratricopeptide (TPR) repeat protein
VFDHPSPNPEEAKVAEEMADIALQGAYEAALEQLQIALSFADQETLAQAGYYNLGNTSYNAQDLESAIASYKQALLLNPASQFFKAKLLDPNSYLRHIRHTDLKAVENAIAAHFIVQTEYYLGVKGEAIFPSQDPREAVLYIVRGAKRTPLPV